MKVLSGIFKQKCPVCHKGNIFSGWNPFNWGKMNTECSNCATNFEKEPGFFYGAMYVSYALAIAESVGIFILCQFFFERFLDPAMIIFILAGIALFSTTNYKLSRVIWVYLFIKKPKV